MKHDDDKRMDCRDAKVLFITRLMGDTDRDSEQNARLELHLLSCKSCAQAYERRQKTVCFIQEHKAFFAQALEARVNVRAGGLRLFRLATAASAAAACLALAICAWHTRTEREPQPPQIGTISQARPWDPSIGGAEPVVATERQSGADARAIMAGEMITNSTAQPRTLAITGGHTLIMNEHTSLLIEPLRAQAPGGLLVKLMFGEIFVEVAPGGCPFAVETAHGRATVTGTAFDIKATSRVTTLVVAEGDVLFASAEDNVQVSAGQRSTIVEQAPPTEPMTCDVTPVLTWANKAKANLAWHRQDRDRASLDDLPVPPFAPAPIDLKTLEYGKWVEHKREWFSQQFPWVFQIQCALARELEAKHSAPLGSERPRHLIGRSVPAYPQLLIRSGDIWQIAYDPGFGGRIPESDPNTLLAIATDYGFDGKWLSASLPRANGTTAEGSKSLGLAALQQWRSAFRRLPQICNDPAKVDALCDYSITLSEYLENTRVLLGLCIRDDKHTRSVHEADKAKRLALLGQVVEVAYACKETAWELSTMNGKPGSEQFSRLVRRMIEKIAKIEADEKELAGIAGAIPEHREKTED